MQGLQSRRPHSWRLMVSFVAAAAVLSTSLSACTTPITGSADSTASSSNKLQAPTEESPSGEITIWDRSGDLFGVFENTIADFNKKYPNIKVHHEAVDIDAKLQNTLITGTDVPDGVFLDDAKVSAFTDHLWDLSDVLNPYIKDISKQKVDVNRKGDGIYGVPFDLNPGLLYYNERELILRQLRPTTTSSRPPRTTRLSNPTLHQSTLNAQASSANCSWRCTPANSALHSATVKESSA